MFERFTDRARKAISYSNQEAQRFNHEYIGTEHILLGVIKEGAGVGCNVLKNCGIDLRVVRLEVEKLVKSVPDMVVMGKLPQTPRAKKVIEYAIAEVRNLSHNYVGTEHLLLGLIKEHEGVAAQVLINLGLSLDKLREEVLNLLKGEAKLSTQNGLQFNVGDVVKLKSGGPDMTITKIKENDFTCSWFLDGVFWSNYFVKESLKRK